MGKTISQAFKELEISDYTCYRWRMDYNQYCPHSSLDYMAPAAFAAI